MASRTTVARPIGTSPSEHATHGWIKTLAGIDKRKTCRIASQCSLRAHLLEVHPERLDHYQIVKQCRDACRKSRSPGLFSTTHTHARNKPGRERVHCADPCAVSMSFHETDSANRRKRLVLRRQPEDGPAAHPPMYITRMNHPRFICLDKAPQRAPC